MLFGFNDHGIFFHFYIFLLAVAVAFSLFFAMPAFAVAMHHRAFSFTTEFFYDDPLISAIHHLLVPATVHTHVHHHVLTLHHTVVHKSMKNCHEENQCNS